jgi:very-short-patch-repair endonuclease
MQDQELPFVPYNTSLTKFARQNRKKSTKTEGIFWHLVLKNKKFLWYKFRRQKVVWSFILDFYCSKLLLWIELDGWYHNDQVEYDQMRDAIIRDYGIEVIRFANEEIENNLEGVIIELEEIIEERKSTLKIL